MPPKRANAAFPFKPGQIAVVIPLSGPRPDFPPWPVLLLPPVKDIKDKSIRKTLEDAPPEDGTVPVKYLGENIFGMVQEAEVHEFSEENLVMPHWIQKHKQRERGVAVEAAHQLLKEVPETLVSQLTEPSKGKAKKEEKIKDEPGVVIKKEAAARTDKKEFASTAKKRKAPGDAEVPDRQTSTNSHNGGPVAPSPSQSETMNDDTSGSDEAPIQDPVTGEYLCPSCNNEKQERTVLKKCSGKESCYEYLCVIHDPDLLCKGSLSDRSTPVFICELHVAQGRWKCKSCQSIVCKSPECAWSTASEPGCCKWSCRRKPSHKLCRDCIQDVTDKSTCPYC
ncbi:hypothetical protein DFJ74DRAFT_688719 [Hyaloraphidium curvatum]|nr:hypothetical protein DFJ74DRAFT_688719 [Hyaloraphidium curvatum]